MTAEKCISTPRVLLNYAAQIPDGGPSVSESHSAPIIAVNATHLYFILQWGSMPTASGAYQEMWHGYLMRIPLGGGRVERIASIPTGSVQMPQGLALTNTDAIFIQAPEADVGNAAIVRVPLDGGHTTVLADAAGDANAVVVDEDNAYFADTEGTKSVPLTGGTVRILASGIIPVSLGLVGKTLYIATSGTIKSVPTKGGDLTTVADSGGLYPISCGSDVCWVSGSALFGTLMQVALGGKPVILAEGISEAHDIAFDGSNFFITGGGGGLVIYRVPVEGGTPVVAYSEFGMTNLALDDTCLYWSSASTITSVSRSAADVATTGD